MGYETPVQMPSMGVYDTDLMKMYIAGVKDQYEKGQEEYKDFLKSYGDFYSPIEGDTENYYNMTIGGAKELIDQIYAMGGDPFKNPEARAAISRYIAGVPTATLNTIRQNAENRRIYDRAVAEAIANGTYNKEYEDWLLKNAGLTNFQTIDPNTKKVKVWDRLTPGMYQDLHTFSDDWFKHLKPKYDDALTKSKRDGYNYNTITEDDLRNVIRQNVPDIINDGGQGQFFYEQALKVAGGDEDAAKTIFENMVVDRNSDRLMIDREIDPYYKSRYDTQQAIYEYRQTTGSDVDDDDDNAETSGVPSYSHAMYAQGVGNLFGIDSDAASLAIVDPENKMGKAIVQVESDLLKRRRLKNDQPHSYDYNAVILDHSVKGNSKQNMELLGVSGLKPRSGSASKSSSTSGVTTALTDDQIQLNSDIKNRIISNYRLVQNNAGYASGRSGYERKGFSDNVKAAKYATITDQIVTQLSKNGRVEQYVKVLLHDKNNKELDAAYIRAQRSVQKRGGQSYASRFVYGTEQPMTLDVVKDYEGRVVKDASATQTYTNKSQKDTDVYVN